ncbi:MAG: YfbM family protein [Actinomycetales bacterium]|jgi:hypothetical protein|nr:YfbM family protein [Candidatus Phosphoribacter baldrii]MBK6954463.1 YfbM family protein [Candidatus Phosphoribacter baldrii]MBK7612078.1 YfbM family protein [Candidatus Phosphoribacter baldrii]
MVMTWTARALTDEEHDVVRSNAKAAATLIEDEPPDPKRGVDLDTAWHGIHWLLTGTAYDTESHAGQAIFGGDAIGADLGHGPAHLIDPRTVKKISAALDALPASEVAARVDFDAMLDANIYPGFWDEQDVFHTWLRPRYKQLRKFYRRAARASSAVLVAIL